MAAAAATGVTAPVGVDAERFDVDCIDAGVETGGGDCVWAAPFGGVRVLGFGDSVKDEAAAEDPP
jgi:hypothetical protein